MLSCIFVFRELVDYILLSFTRIFAHFDILEACPKDLSSVQLNSITSQWEHNIIRTSSERLNALETYFNYPRDVSIAQLSAVNDPTLVVLKY